VASPGTYIHTPNGVKSVPKRCSQPNARMWTKHVSSSKQGKGRRDLRIQEWKAISSTEIISCSTSLNLSRFSVVEAISALE
jgi:hypothetical protein